MCLLPLLLLLLLRLSIGGPANVRQLRQMLTLLGVPPLSACVSLKVRYEELASWDEMAQRVAAALLMAQRWAWHNKTRDAYEAMSGGCLPPG